VKKILVVDDVADNRDLISQFLQTDYEVLEAEDGKEAVTIASGYVPDLILMDLSLPLMTGWQAAEIIKGNPATRHIQIVALTAHAMDGDREKALKAGCDEYLAKPVTRAELLQMIRSRIG
jgi:two-component system, cell cycle response regulator DivK